MTHAAPARQGAEDAALRYSIFTIHDHYPDMPRTLPQLYAEAIEQCQLAEQCGYDSFFVAEHHFAPYGAVPNPAVFLSHLAAHTEKIRLGSAISVLSFHPAFEVAENYGMVDILSKGRVTLGVGSGYLSHELAGYNVDMATKREIYDESMSILQKALTGTRFSHEGVHFQIQDMQINVPAVQKPGIPIYVAVSNAAVAFFVGKQGHNMMFVPYSQLEKVDDVGGVYDIYRKGRAEIVQQPGGEPDAGDVIVAFHAHVAESDDEAKKRAHAPFELYLRTRQRAKHQSFEAISSDEGLSLIGCPATVAAKLARLHALGVRHVMLTHNFGNMPAAHAAESIRLFATEVMPLFNRLVAEPTLAITA
jgi:alkanesulfonate monooxygenase SsuD/methylene tetrahydromethanopterin reductase-like flavin-dependent oxidoreductase (luciferase family)